MTAPAKTVVPPRRVAGARWRLLIFLGFVVLTGLVAWYATGAKPQETPRTKPLALRTSLVDTLRQEKLEETVNNLPNFDDFHWAYSSLGNTFHPDNSYTYAVIVYPRLFRVRKILEQGRQDATPVIP